MPPALEAVLGAVYLDGGVVAVTALIDRLFSERLVTAALQLDHLDHKTMLQEISARMYDTAPVYLISDSGPDHAKHFVATAIVAGRSLGRGEGRSKKVAEQMAAERACAVLRDETEPG